MFRGGKVFGNVDLTDGRDFVLEPCSAFKGCHVWKVGLFLFLEFLF